jgi:hypothetical protein
MYVHSQSIREPKGNSWVGCTPYGRPEDHTDVSLPFEYYVQVKGARVQTMLWPIRWKYPGLQFRLPALRACCSVGLLTLFPFKLIRVRTL